MNANATQTTKSLTRRSLLEAGCTVAGTGLTIDALFPTTLSAEDKADPSIGRRELILGLDGMSRVVEQRRHFGGGHNAAAVMASAFFCREQKIGEGAPDEIFSFVQKTLLTSSIYKPRPKEMAAPELVDGLVKDLDAGIVNLRRGGHNIIFATLCLKALKDVPEAATPQRIDGLRKMVAAFGKSNGRERPTVNDGTLVDMQDKTKFVAFIFKEYLNALDLYLNGKGHHGFAGHILTAGHALLELSRLGHPEIARKGTSAYWQLVQQARAGADRGGRRVKDGPPKSPTPLDQDYWSGKTSRRPREVVSSHLIKYPYSFYALAKDLRDEELKRRIFEQLFHLSAIT
ncbi:MAG: hypothetical protein CMJ78_22950 [Planctomycetaceae bacterium]|nr:hypothetical protein [Planctomycetaceae bacterium]